MADSYCHTPFLDDHPRFTNEGGALLMLRSDTLTCVQESSVLIARDCQPMLRRPAFPPPANRRDLAAAMHGADNIFTCNMFMGHTQQGLQIGMCGTQPCLRK